MGIPLSMPNCPQRTIGTQDSVDVSAILGSERPEGLPTRRRVHTPGM